MAWHKKHFNIQNIKHQTDRAVLIQMPHSSNHDGFSFWHPSKLVRSGNNSYDMTFSFTDDFKFNLKKMGQGQHNWDQIIDEQQISAAEMVEIHFN